MENQDILHIKGFLPKEFADRAFKVLTDEVQWHDELAKDNGEINKINRKMAYMYDKVVDYRYANLTLPGTTWHPVAEEVRDFLSKNVSTVVVNSLYTEEELQELRDYWKGVKEKNPELYETLAQDPGYPMFSFNSVLLNLYQDGKNEIRWHSDKEEQLGNRPVIACINLGAGRNFSFLRKRAKDADPNSKTERLDYFVEHGDLIMMFDECQERWLHAILQDKSVTQPRISLTFRQVKEE